jgi:hypothetical protein
MKTAVADLPADVRPAKEGLGGRADKATEELTVVLCDVTPKAMELQFVEQTLAKRQVVLLARPANIGDDRGRAFGGGFALAEMEKKPEVARREADSAAAGDKLAPQSGMGADSGKIVFLRAEATPEQLEAVLVDLRSKPEMVRSLARESGVAGPVADGTEQWFFFGRAASVMKQKGDSAPGKSLAAQSAPRDAARGFQTAEPMERWDVNVQDRPAEARSAGGARGAAQMQGAQDPSATANMVQSESVTNRLQNMEMQRRAVEKRGQEGQEMYGATRQKAIDATQALGVRAAGPSVKKAERKAQQGEQQADESESHPPAGAAAAPAQQAMPGGQAGAVAGYRSPSPATAKAKSLADASFDAKAQREVKRPVVFVVRAVGPDPIAAEKAGKPAAAAPK